MHAADFGGPLMAAGCPRSTRFFCCARFGAVVHRIRARGKRHSSQCRRYSEIFFMFACGATANPDQGSAN
jgi:hypothetical protein